MKKKTEKRAASGVADYIALALTTFGVGYIPGAPGTYGSVVGVVIYFTISDLLQPIYSSRRISSDGLGSPSWLQSLWMTDPQTAAWIYVAIVVLVALLCLLGIWASGRSIPLLGNSDPSQAVVDEVMGQLVTFMFVPFGISWPFILAGFLLFRLFDIWKPYPIDDLQVLPGGLGICADDLVAGVYAGGCLAVGYAVYLSL